MPRGSSTEHSPTRRVDRDSLRAVWFVGPTGASPRGYANTYGDDFNPQYTTSDPEQALMNVQQNHAREFGSHEDAFLQLETHDYQAGGPKTRVKGLSGRAGREQRAADYNREKYGIE